MFPTAQAAAGTSESFSILVVEDDLPMSRLLTLLLSRGGYRVRTATSIAEARAALSREPSDLIILDRNLPDGDGSELARELKQGDRAHSRYVLMLTAVSSPEAKVEGFESGADDYVTKPFAHEELLARVRAGLRIVELQKALIATNRRLELMSITDSGTGARNRRWFDEELERSFERARRYDRPLSLLILDIDHFKRVNDTYGHVAGDAVLETVAARIMRGLRTSDSLARIGGEEFAVILTETALFEAVQAGEKIRSICCADDVDAAGMPIQVTLSIGAASIPHSRLERASQLMWYADQALYRAKNRGRNRVEIERRAEPWRITAKPGVHPRSDFRHQQQVSG